MDAVGKVKQQCRKVLLIFSVVRMQEDKAHFWQPFQMLVRLI
jgi:hypothetical protein